MQTNPKIIWIEKSLSLIIGSSYATCPSIYRHATIALIYSEKKKNFKKVLGIKT